MEITMTAKYIVVENNLGDELSIVFDNHFKHSDFKELADEWGKIVGAGRCTFTVPYTALSVDPHVQCYGFSTSLNVDSRKTLDAQAIMKSFLHDA
jgi:hypothetical protein